MLLVFCLKLTNRVRYIFEHVFDQNLGIPISFTDDKEAFIAHEGPKLNYSNRKFTDEIFFYACSLLFERGIKKQQVKVEDYEGYKIFFISRNNSHLPFDLFAASFFLITRYEEYWVSGKDQFGRFKAESSLAYQHDFLHKPLIDIWIEQLKKVLLSKYPSLKFATRKYSFVPTYDIDIAYAYVHKGFLRNWGGYLIDLKNLDFTTFKHRLKTHLGRKKDPYDTFDWQIKLQRKYKLRPIYFFLVGDYSLYDKNISIDSPTYQDLIQSINDIADVGIHPSYESNKSLKRIEREIKRLTQVLKTDIKQSRQHYLKLSIPSTYQNLLEYDIKKDYTMGYADHVGFRASTASSFYFYDISLEIKTILKVFPFCVMDVTLQHYLNLNPADALQMVKKLIKEIKAVDGLFMTLWHNHTLGEIQGWKGWRAVYEKIVKMAVP